MEAKKEDRTFDVSIFVIGLTHLGVFGVIAYCIIIKGAMKTLSLLSNTMYIKKKYVR